MVKELKSKIDNMKKDKKTINNFLENFCNNAKVEELYKKSIEFRKLKESIRKKQ